MDNPEAETLPHDEQNAICTVEEAEDEVETLVVPVQQSLDNSQSKSEVKTKVTINLTSRSIFNSSNLVDSDSSEDIKVIPNHNRTDNLFSLNASMPKTTLLGKLKAKQRLNAFLSLKQNVSSSSPLKKLKECDENFIKTESKMSPVKKVNKKFPDDIAKAVIEEIEMIKKVEIAMIEAIEQSGYDKRSQKSKSKSRSRSRERERERNARYKERSYRRYKSRSRSAEKKSRYVEKDKYPRSWSEVKERRLSLDDIKGIKSFSSWPQKRSGECPDFRDQLMFNAPSVPLSPLVIKLINGQQKPVPAQHVRYTEANPSISYSINFIKNKDIYITHKEVLQLTPKPHRDILKKFKNGTLPTLYFESPKKSPKKWFPKTAFSNVMDNRECELLEPSLGLSILQNYTDEEDEEEKEKEPEVEQSIVVVEEDEENDHSKGEKHKEEELSVDVCQKIFFSEKEDLSKSEDVKKLENVEESKKRKKKIKKTLKYKEKEDRSREKKRKRRKEKREREEKKKAVKSKKTKEKYDDHEQEKDVKRAKKFKDSDKSTTHESRSEKTIERKPDYRKKSYEKTDRKKRNRSNSNELVRIAEGVVKKGLNWKKDRSRSRDREKSTSRTRRSSRKTDRREDHKYAVNKEASRNKERDVKAESKKTEESNSYSKTERKKMEDADDSKKKTKETKDKDPSKAEEKTSDNSKKQTKETGSDLKVGNRKVEESSRLNLEEKKPEEIKLTSKDSKDDKDVKLNKSNDNHKKKSIRPEPDLRTPDTDEYHSHWESDEDVSNVMSYSPSVAEKSKEILNSSWESDEDVIKNLPLTKPKPKGRYVDVSPQRSFDRRPRKSLEGPEVERSLEMPLNIKHVGRRNSSKRFSRSDEDFANIRGPLKTETFETRLLYSEDSWERGEYLKIYNDIENQKLRQESETLSEERRLLEQEKRILAEKLEKCSYKYNNYDSIYTREIAYENIDSSDEDFKSVEYTEEKSNRARSEKNERKREKRKKDKKHEEKHRDERRKSTDSDKKSSTEDKNQEESVGEFDKYRNTTERREESVGEVGKYRNTERQEESVGKFDKYRKSKEIQEELVGEFDKYRKSKERQEPVREFDKYRKIKERQEEPVRELDKCLTIKERQEPVGEFDKYKRKERESEPVGDFDNCKEIQETIGEFDKYDKYKERREEPVGDFDNYHKSNEIQETIGELDKYRKNKERQEPVREFDKYRKNKERQEEPVEDFDNYHKIKGIQETIGEFDKCRKNKERQEPVREVDKYQKTKERQEGPVGEFDKYFKTKERQYPIAEIEKYCKSKERQETPEDEFDHYYKSKEIQEALGEFDKYRKTKERQEEPVGELDKYYGCKERYKTSKVLPEKIFEDYHDDIQKTSKKEVKVDKKKTIIKEEKTSKIKPEIVEVEKKRRKNRWGSLEDQFVNKDVDIINKDMDIISITIEDSPSKEYKLEEETLTKKNNEDDVSITDNLEQKNLEIFSVADFVDGKKTKTDDEFKFVDKEENIAETVKEDKTEKAMTIKSDENSSAAVPAAVVPLPAEPSINKVVILESEYEEFMKAVTSDISNSESYKEEKVYTTDLEPKTESILPKIQSPKSPKSQSGYKKDGKFRQKQEDEKDGKYKEKQARKSKKRKYSSSSSSSSDSSDSDDSSYSSSSTSSSSSSSSSSSEEEQKKYKSNKKKTQNQKEPADKMMMKHRIITDLDDLKPFPLSKDNDIFSLTSDEVLEGHISVAMKKEEDISVPSFVSKVIPASESVPLPVPSPAIVPPPLISQVTKAAVNSEVQPASPVSSTNIDSTTSPVKRPSLIPAKFLTPILRKQSSENLINANPIFSALDNAESEKSFKYVESFEDVKVETSAASERLHSPFSLTTKKLLFNCSLSDNSGSQDFTELFIKKMEGPKQIVSCSEASETILSESDVMKEINDTMKKEINDTIDELMSEAGKGRKRERSPSTIEQKSDLSHDNQPTTDERFDKDLFRRDLSPRNISPKRSRNRSLSPRRNRNTSPSRSKIPASMSPRRNRNLSPRSVSPSRSRDLIPASRSPKRNRDLSPKYRKLSPRRELSPRRRNLSPPRKDDYLYKKGSSPRRKGVSPKRSASPRYRNASPRRNYSPRRNASPHRRPASPYYKGTSQKRDYRDSPLRYRDGSPRYRDVSPGRRRYSPKGRSSPRRRDYSPRGSRRRRSPSPRRRRYSYSRSPSIDRKKEPIQVTLQRLAGLDDYSNKINKSPVNSPLDGFKRSLADSTISDDQLPQHNSDEYLESPRNSFYFNKFSRLDSPSSPKRMPLDERINFVLGLDKDIDKPVDVSYVANYVYDQYGGQYNQYIDYEHQSVQKPNYVPEQKTASTKVLQMGNVLEVVPTEDIQCSSLSLTKKQETTVKQKILQVGNMLQIVPTVTHQSPVRPNIAAPIKRSPMLTQPSSKSSLVTVSAQLSKATSVSTTVAVPPPVLPTPVVPLPVLRVPALPPAVVLPVPTVPPPVLPIHAVPPPVHPVPAVPPPVLPVPAVPPPALPVPALPSPVIPVSAMLLADLSKIVLPIDIELPSAIEKVSPEAMMKQKVAERKAERERRHEEREKKRKDKEKRRKEREQQKQIKIKQKTENMIKQAILLETEALAMGADMEDQENVEDVSSDYWSGVPIIVSNPTVKPAGKGILISHGFSKMNIEEEGSVDRRKSVKFADGVVPGEGTSPSGGEELSSPPPAKPQLPKEKRYTKCIKTKKTKKIKVPKKKKIKVKIIRKAADSQDDDEDDNLPPPSPPPGSPPPHLFPSRIKTHTINNIHPSFVTSTQSVVPVSSFHQFTANIPINMPPPPPHRPTHGPPLGPPPGLPPLPHFPPPAPIHPPHHPPHHLPPPGPRH